VADDQISKPATGRYFPYPAKDIKSAIERLQFLVPSYGDRLQIIMENSKVECDRGYQLCSFLPTSYAALFSLPDSVSSVVSRKAIDLALETFSEIDKGPRPSVREHQFIIYRAFLGPLSTLSITQHIINGGNRPYLQFRKSTHLPKSSSSTKGQQEVLKAQVA